MLLAHPDFQGTITLGTILVGVLVAILFFLGSLKDRQTGRWRDLYQLADQERKELQEELNEAREIISGLKEQVAKLEALQMPKEVMRALHDSTSAAATRQLGVLRALENHEVSAERRGQAQLALLGLIADRLGPDNGEHKEGGKL